MSLRELPQFRLIRNRYEPLKAWQSWIWSFEFFMQTKDNLNDKAKIGWLIHFGGQDIEDLVKKAGIQPGGTESYEEVKQLVTNWIVQNNRLL